MSVFQVQLFVLGSWLAADFLTGLVHLWEDKFMGSSTLNFLDSLHEDNDLHHRKPTAMLLSSEWTNMKSGAAFGWPLALLCWFVGLQFLSLTLFFVGFGNLIHRWSHVPKKQLPRWIRAMQELGLFISQEQHDLHHRSMNRLIPKHESGFRFCGMSDWLNPVLDATRFWHGLEWLIKKAGVKTSAQRLG